MKIKKITIEQNEDVFDIEMKINHNFFANEILVHNCEVSLRPNQFCNLTEVNVSNVESQNDLNNRVKAASFIGTLQASYTDFHYLRPVWQRNTEKDSLIGVGMTGIASGAVLKLDLNEAGKVVKQENKRVANLLGINSASRTTVVKPSGTSSLVAGTASGIHAWFAKWYKRRLRIGKNESLYQYLVDNHPELIEDEYFRPHDTAVIQVPQMAPDGSITREESVFAFLERIKKFNIEWIRSGHRRGENYNNVSATVSIKDDEWNFVGDWMWENRNTYNGLSVLPFDGGTYKQPPFEEITKDDFNKYELMLSNIDLTQVKELEDMTDLSSELACAGNSCEIR